MKKILSISLLLLFLITASCSKDNPWIGPEDGEGQLSLKQMSVDVVNAEKVISRASTDVSNYIVSIIRATDNQIVKTWKYAEMPEIITLAVGDYSVKVESGEVKAADWESPYFAGTKSFSITDGKITEVGKVTCVLANVKVSIRYSDALKAVMETDCNVDVTVGEKGKLNYKYDETRPGFFEFVPNSTTMVVVFRGTVDQNSTTMRKVFTDIAAGQHQIITFTLKSTDPEVPDEEGTINPSVAIDATVTTIDLTVDVPTDEEIIDDQSERPGEGDDPDPGPGPGPDPGPGDDNPPVISSTSLDLDGVNVITSGMVAKVDIHADNGIKNFVVDIISETLTEELLKSVGLSSHFDLAYPGDMKQGLDGLGFPTGDMVIDKNDLTFDISSFMSLLKAFTGTHQFRLTITDNKDLTTSKTLTFLAQ